MDKQTEIAIEVGVRAQGNKELKKFSKGQRLTRGESILAKCYECSCGYHDGRVDCQVTGCPLHPYMPYNPKSSNPAEPEEAATGQNAPEEA